MGVATPIIIKANFSAHQCTLSALFKHFIARISAIKVDYTHLFPTLVHVHVVIEFPKHVHVQMYMYANVYRLVHVHVFDKTYVHVPGCHTKREIFPQSIHFRQHLLQYATISQLNAFCDLRSNFERL